MNDSKMEVLMNRRYGWAAALSTAIFLFWGATASVEAGVIYTTAVGATLGNGQEASALAELNIVNGMLQIRLENTATTGEGNITRLTNFEFNVKDGTTWSLNTPTSTVGSVLVEAGSSIVDGFTPSYGAGASNDISGGWVFGTDVVPDAGVTDTFDYGVSSTAFHNGNQLARFDGSTVMGNYTDGFGNAWGAINGGDWGLIGSSPWGYTGASIRSAVIITLGVTGTLSLDDIDNVVFTYGSETEGVPGGAVPEPGSLAIWCLGVFGSTVLIRRQRKTRLAK